MADNNNTNDPNIIHQPPQEVPPVMAETPVSDQQVGVANEQLLNEQPTFAGVSGEMPNQGEQVYSPPVESYSSNVAVGSDGGGIPRWFYVVFAVTLIAFLVVTYFLIMTILKPQGTPVVSEPTPTPLSEISPSPVVTVFEISPIPTPDLVVRKYQSLNSSDEVAEIGNDINDTDLAPILETLTLLDTEMKKSL